MLKRWPGIEGSDRNSVQDIRANHALESGKPGVENGAAEVIVPEEIALVETFPAPLHLNIVKKSFKWILLGVIAVFALLQLTTLGRSTPSATPGHDLLSSTNSPPPEIATLLRGACYDCHSYETRWPWYGYVAPVSWWLDDHVNDARQRLNFSEWPQNDPQKAAKRWNHVSDTVRDGDMPLPSYAWIHKAARLTPEQRKQLADWAEQEAQRLHARASAAQGS